MVGAMFRRILMAIPVMIGATLGIFLILQLGPGDPAVLAAGGQEADPETIERVREQLGLNDPVLVQYFRMISSYAQGDLGTSIFSSQSVGEAIWVRFPTTLSLAVGGMLLGLLFAIPAGILAAAKVGSRIDRGVIAFSTVGIASPQFFIGLLLVLFLRETFLPATGYVPITTDVGRWALHLVLPSITLGVAVAAELARHVRAAMLAVLDTDYIRTAKAKGVPNRLVLGKHALKNAALTILTVVGLLFQSLIAGTVAVEAVFAAPGLGSLIVVAAINRDFPMIQGLLAFIVLSVVMLNVIIDLLYTVLNPKVRVS